MKAFQSIVGTRISKMKRHGGKMLGSLLKKMLLGISILTRLGFLRTAFLAHGRPTS